MKTLLIGLVLVFGNIASAHEYQRANFSINCTMWATKQTLTHSEIQLPKRYNHQLSAKIVDGRFLGIVFDSEIHEQRSSVLRQTMDYSNYPQRPTTYNMNNFANPLALNPATSLNLAIAGFGNNLNAQVEAVVVGFMKFQTSGPVTTPAMAADLTQLFAAFGETLTNPQDLIVEYHPNPAAGRIQTSNGYYGSYDEMMQVHFPESINGGASYHFKLNCGTQLARTN